MAQEIIFDILHEYDTREVGIVLPATLRFGEDTVTLKAKVDTGSTFCVFERIHGERLGFDIESGTQMQISTATGSFLTYGHTVNLSVLGIETESIVYFAAEESFLSQRSRKKRMAQSCKTRFD